MRAKRMSWCAPHSLLPVISAAVCAIVLGAASIAAAQARLRPPTVIVSPQAHARAAELTTEAQARYDAGHYEQATESYRRAYAVVPAPELLFNLGQCQRLLGRSQRAVKYFEAYLRLRPDAPHRPLVEQLIEESKLISPSDTALRPESEEPPAISAAPAGSSAAPQPQRVQNSSVMPLPPPEPLSDSQAQSTRLLADDGDPIHETPAVYERWWFWTAIAVVAAGAAVTTYGVMSTQEDEPQAMTTLGMVAWD